MRAGHQPPSTAQAHDVLTAALQDQATWEQRRRSAKELLNEMLASRREAAELAKLFDTRCAAALPYPIGPAPARGCGLGGLAAVRLTARLLLCWGRLAAITRAARPVPCGTMVPSLRTVRGAASSGGRRRSILCAVSTAADAEGTSCSCVKSAVDAGCNMLTVQSGLHQSWQMADGLYSSSCYTCSAAPVRRSLPGSTTPKQRV